MAFSLVTTEGGKILKLEGAVTIGDVQQLATTLAEGLEDKVPIGVDTRDLEQIDTCALQLLCSLRKTAGGLSFEEESDAFLGAVARCGLRRELLNARDGLQEAAAE